MAGTEHSDEALKARSGAIPCPFVYANGKRCAGHIVRVEAYKADLSWVLGDDGVWHFSYDWPRSHYHLFCSAKGNHVGFGRPDSEKMKVRFLPDELRRVHE
jgi:hypothetical protein